VIPAIRIVPIALYFVPRDRNEFPVLPPLSEPLSVLKFHFRGVTVRFVAARSVRLIRHEPGRVEFLVGWKISRRVSGVAFLRDYRCRDEGKQYDLDKHARLFHGLAPVREQPRPNSTRLTPLNSEEKITI
jgi:hypothetical protein